MQVHLHVKMLLWDYVYSNDFCNIKMILRLAYVTVRTARYFAIPYLSPSTIRRQAVIFDMNIMLILTYINVFMWFNA